MDLASRIAAHAVLVATMLLSACGGSTDLTGGSTDLSESAGADLSGRAGAPDMAVAPAPDLSTLPDLTMRPDLAKAAPAGACSNMADTTQLGMIDVAKVVGDCATMGFGQEPATTEQVATGFGVTDGDVAGLSGLR